MRKLHLHDHAAGDLRRMYAEGGDAAFAARHIASLIQELNGSPRIADVMLPSGSGHVVNDVDYARFSSLWRRKADLWRLKAIDLERKGIKYRVVYCYVISTNAFHILAVVPRGGYNYELDHPITRRILDDYDAIVR